MLNLPWATAIPELVEIMIDEPDVVVNVVKADEVGEVVEVVLEVV